MGQEFYVHNLNPIIFEIPGLGLKVAWYGLMYVLGFIVGFYLLRKLWKDGFINFAKEDDIGDLLTYLVIGVLVGGRLGHVIFYDPGFYFSHPLEILEVWKGGMASHGGIIGVIVAVYIYSKKYKLNLLRLFDVLAMIGAPGLGFGRFGNFINGEMVGKVTHVPWAVIFPKYDMLPRHPVQIYQSLTEGLAVFLILWFLVPRNKFAQGSHGAIFLISYGILRIFTEYFRELDPGHLGFYFGFLTMGQLLSIVMVISGLVMFAVLNRKKTAD